MIAWGARLPLRLEQVARHGLVEHGRDGHANAHVPIALVRAARAQHARHQRPRVRARGGDQQQGELVQVAHAGGHDDVAAQVLRRAHGERDQRAQKLCKACEPMEKPLCKQGALRTALAITAPAAHSRTICRTDRNEDKKSEPNSGSIARPIESEAAKSAVARRPRLGKPGVRCEVARRRRVAAAQGNSRRAGDSYANGPTRAPNPKRGSDLCVMLATATVKPWPPSRAHRPQTFFWWYMPTFEELLRMT